LLKQEKCISCTVIVNLFHYSKERVFYVVWTAESPNYFLHYSHWQGAS
jgi:hypothetical protein